MQVILVDNIYNLGKRGDVVKVADGYGRNYLIPKRLAIPATPGNLKMIEQQRVVLAKKEANYKEEGQLLAQELEQLHVIIGRKAGENGILFGSVSSRDVVVLLEQEGIQLDRRKIILHEPIKRIGNYKIETHPHSEVVAELLLSVLMEADEPLTRVKKKDEESARLVAELEDKIKEIEQLSKEPEEPEPEKTESSPPEAEEPPSQPGGQ